MNQTTPGGIALFLPFIIISLLFLPPVARILRRTGAQSVVVLDCVVSFGDLHRSLDISVRSVAHRGQEVNHYEKVP
ncbi:MAG: hypothetical protein WB680_18475 [Candidatus Acidiferrales bacterium]